MSTSVSLHDCASNSQSPASVEHLLSSNLTENLTNLSQDAKVQGKWSVEEDKLLKKYVDEFGEKQWQKISQKIPGRTSIQCLHRWSKILRPGLIKGPWTAEEDMKLINWVNKNGPTQWTKAGEEIEGRSGKQCRERWFNSLNPDVKKGGWTAEEDKLIFDLFQQHGSSWSKISKLLPGRSENSVKNRFYSTLRKTNGTVTKEQLENLTINLKKVKSDETSRTGPSVSVSRKDTASDDESLEKKTLGCSNNHLFNLMKRSFSEQVGNPTKSPLSEDSRKSIPTKLLSQMKNEEAADESPKAEISLNLTKRTSSYKTTTESEEFERIQKKINSFCSNEMLTLNGMTNNPFANPFFAAQSPLNAFNQGLNFPTGNLLGNPLLEQLKAQNNIAKHLVPSFNSFPQFNIDPFSMGLQSDTLINNSLINNNTNNLSPTKNTSLKIELLNIKKEEQAVSPNLNNNQINNVNLATNLLTNKNNFDNMLAMSSIFSSLNAQNMLNPFGGLAAQNIFATTPNTLNRSINPLETLANQKNAFQSFQFPAFQ